MTGAGSGPRPDELHAQIQHRLIEELSASERRYRELVESLHEVVFQCDGEERFTFLNKHWQSLLGHPLSESIGRSIGSFIVAEDRCLWPGLPKDADQSVEVEVRFRCAGDSFCWLRVAVRAGQRGAWSGLLYDVTGRRELEEQLRQAQKMDAIGRLAGGVAHDFNNLLTVILGAGEQLLEDADTDANGHRRDDVVAILEAGGRAASLTRQLLAFSRRQVMRYDVVCLVDVIDEMKDMLQRLIGSHIEIDVQARGVVGRVRVDPAQLQQVILNLAVNARDAMPKGGTLTFRVADIVVREEEPRPSGLELGPCVLMSVTDSGEGISPEHVDRIFEPFFTTKVPGEGTGLGLAMVYGIVRQSGGAVEVTSEPGCGTTFRIYFPRPEGASASSAVRAAVPASGGTETILVVEDEEMVRRLAVRSLARAGYVVIEATQGAEALRVAAAHGGRIDILVTDVVMPGMGGRALATALGRDRPGLKVLLVSGYDGGTSLEQGAVSFLAKPYRTQVLLRKVREVLDGR